MRYLPHTDADIASMLKVAKADNLEGLFPTVPEDCRCTGDLRLPGPLTEWELNDFIDALAGNIAVSPEYKIFIGAGSYEHYIPSSASYLLSRSEFVTSYTPYQPEMSQGTLQAIFEYQTLTSRLLGMEVANASLYDGASALAEALLMATRITRRNKIAVSSLIHPMYRRVVETYLKPTGFEIIELPYLENGRTDLTPLDKMEELAAVAVQSPNFFGCVEDLKAVGEKAQENKVIFITSFTEPLAYGLLKNPGSLGADIACGEGQSMGIPRSFGGPVLGMFAAKMKYVRNMPGRLVGETKDKDGKRGFVLTLATREQHIRREKATSNICSNQGICALTAAAYMASLGNTGLRRIAKLNYDKAAYLKDELIQAGAQLLFSGSTFNEFALTFSKDFKAIRKRLLDKGIIAGIDLGRFYEQYQGAYLFCVTETVSKKILDEFIKEVRS